LLEETGVPGENHQPVANPSVSLVFYLEIRIKHKQTSMVNHEGFPNRTSIEDKFLKDDDIDIRLEEYEE
jgi:hypothetical protein